MSFVGQSGEFNAVDNLIDEAEKLCAIDMFFEHKFKIIFPDGLVDAVRYKSFDGIVIDLLNQRFFLGYFLLFLEIIDPYHGIEAIEFCATPDGEFERVLIIPFID